MNKKSLAVFLLILAIVATLAVPALAADAPTLHHCVCGAKWYDSTGILVKDGVCMTGCLQTKNLAWLPLSENLSGSTGAKSLPTSGNFYLDKNINVDSTTYAQILRIDLNGYTLSRTMNRVIHMSGTNAQQLVITDTSEEKNGVLQSNLFDSGDGAVIRVDNGTCLMFGGIINGGAAKSGSKVPAKGGSVYLGVGSNVYSGSKFYMYDGTITGGYAQSAGNVAVDHASSAFHMYGGTIENGVATTSGGNVGVRNNATFNMHGGVIQNGSTVEGATKHGGNIRVSDSGVFNLHNGIIRDGAANGSTSNGGNIALIGASSKLNLQGGIISGGTSGTGADSVWVHGGVNDTGSLTVSGAPKVNSIYLSKDTQSTDGGSQEITLNGLIAGAEIGIQMQVGLGTFVSSGATIADIGYFSMVRNNTYIILDNGKIRMTDAIGTNTAAIASGLFPTIGDAIAAITDRDKQSVKLIQNTSETVTVTGDLYLDLNGKTLNGNNVTVNGGTLKVFDSKTDDYSVADGNYGKITGTVTGSIASDFVNPATHYRYVTIAKNEGLSAHRIYLAVTHSVIDSNNYSAMNFKTIFKCDEVVADQVENYGFTVGGVNTPYANATVDPWSGMNLNEKTTTITGFLQENGEDNQYYAELEFGVNAYIKLKDNRVVNSAVKSRSLKQMVEETLSQWDSKLLVSQKKTLKKMYNTYNQDGFMSDWNGMENVEQFVLDTVNSITDVGYSAVNINPIDGMFKGQDNQVGLLGMGNEGTRFVTGVDPDAPLMAICLAVTDQDGNTVLLISVDAAGINDTAAQRVVTGITALGYGVKEGNIMIASNHQHSTPNFTSAYSNYFVSQVVEGARLALEDRKEVTSMVAQVVEVGENTFNFVRNVQYTDANGNPIPGAMKTDNHDDKNRDISYSGKTYESTADDDVQLVKITRQGDTQPIVMANFQTHPHLGTSGDKTIATADMIGIFRSTLEEELNCKAMYFTGSSGNINAWSEVDTSKEKADLNYITQGQNLALAVKNGIQESAWFSVVSPTTNGVAVKTVTKQYSVMLNSVPSWLEGKVTMDQIVAYAANFWNEEDGYLKNTTANDLKNYGIYSKYHAKYIIQRSTNNATDTKLITISAITIGDLAFVVAPYEMYDTNGMQIKAAFPDKVVFTTQQADMPTSNRVKMSNGYIPSALSYANGGYSVDIATFAAGTGEALAQDYIGILNELYN